MCSFNITSGTSQNVTTEPISYSNTTVVCPFPNTNDAIQPGVITVRIYSCGSSLVITNAFPIYAYDEPPSIVSIDPAEIVATGMNATVTIQNPIPFDIGTGFITLLFSSLLS